MVIYCSGLCILNPCGIHLVQTWMAFIQTFARGAILMVLANSMIPESYEHGGKLTGLFLVFGFFISVSMIIIE